MVGKLHLQVKIRNWLRIGYAVARAKTTTATLLADERWSLDDYDKDKYFLHDLLIPCRSWKLLLSTNAFALQLSF